jgi:Xaa-Pro dipeptidase
MSIPKIKTSGGSGGKRGHSNMDHWMFTEEVKEASRRRRRLEDKSAVVEEMAALQNRQELEHTGASELQTPAFTPDEYARRVQAVRRIMEERDLDALVVSRIANICYLTGVETAAHGKYMLALITPDGEPGLLIQDFESHNALASGWLSRWDTYRIGEDYVAATGRWLDAHGLVGRSVGVDLGGHSVVSVRDYQKLSALPGVHFIDATGLVERARVIKSPAEIECHRQAGLYSALTMSACLDAVQPGVTDNHVAAAGYQAGIAAGSEYSAYPLFVTTGRRSGIPHTTFHRAVIEAGDPVFIEVGGCHLRYISPQMRVAVAGRPGALLESLAAFCVNSVNAMIETIRPGMDGMDVARRAAQELRDMPEDIVWHGDFGYSVGLGFPHTWDDTETDLGAVMIRTDTSCELKPGMVFHCSTSLRKIGVAGATCSETVLVTPGGCEILTGQIPRELIRK